MNTIIRSRNTSRITTYLVGHRNTSISVFCVFVYQTMLPVKGELLVFHLLHAEIIYLGLVWLQSDRYQPTLNKRKGYHSLAWREHNRWLDSMFITWQGTYVKRWLLVRLDGFLRHMYEDKNRYHRHQFNLSLQKVVHTQKRAKVFVSLFNQGTDLWADWYPGLVDHQN